MLNAYRMTAEPSNALTNDKNDGGTPATHEFDSLPSASSNIQEREKRPVKPTQRQDIAQDDEKGRGTTGTVNTRSRVIKRPRKDLVSTVSASVKKRCPSNGMH